MKALPSLRIDLYSDTSSRPTPEMRAFMCGAEVGDEQKGEDPSVNRLQSIVCRLTGKEASLFLPSGTMCNQIAFAVHSRPGDLILVERTAHPLTGEAGAAAVISSATLYPIDGRRGMFTDRQVEESLRAPSRHRPGFSLVSVEQSTNLAGGHVWPLNQLVEVCRTAHRLGAQTHMDGARIFNAAAASGISVEEFAAPFDSVWIDLTKGLGAPVGAVLAGSQAFIEQAWQWKQRLGGAMRQAGILAAAGIYALEHHLDRIQEDHDNAKRLAQELAACPALSVDAESVETNIVRFDVSGTGLSASAFAQRLLAQTGVRVSVIDRNLCRAVTYIGITAAHIEEAAAQITALALAPA